METVEKCSGGAPSADHLCVLVHGLWGNPAHLAQVAKALRDQHPPEKLYIIVAKRNSGSFTYDGIELGGERVCLEIEEELQTIKSNGGNIKKISFVGYSLGGLVARYAIGLLEAKGVLDNLECMNFTAFSSPFLGVRTPLKGWANNMFNVLGARTLAMSGRQLFGIDKFRDTGKPLISVLTEPNSAFMSGLRRFKRRTLYTNILNDRTANYYTTSISKTDPYVNIDKLKINFVDGYDNVILDPDHPFSPAPSAVAPKSDPLRRVPLVMALAVLLPIGIVAFLINSGVQTVRSSKRVRLHNEGRAGIDVAGYRGLPLWIKEVRGAVEDAYENINGAQGQQFLASADASEDEAGGAVGTRRAGRKEKDDDDDDEARLSLERKQSHRAQPTLALAPYQFKMIDALDSLGWHKYPVWIHNSNHSHAAIIVRTVKPSFDEGYQVFKHWLDNEFNV